MNNRFETLKNRLHTAFGWESIKFLLLSIAVIALVISIFDFEPDLEHWFYEILRNIVNVAFITFFDYTLLRLFGIDRNNKSFRALLVISIILICGGLIGGFLGWAINAWLFGFHVTSTLYYAIIVSGFSLIFGLIIFSISSLQERLQKVVHKLAEKEINEHRLLQLKARAELEALQAKINPHFLFNTINSISELIHNDPSKADEILQKLANLLRYTLAASSHDFIKLEEEIEVIEGYLEIEKTRLQDRLTYRIEMDDSLSNQLIPGMLLQPLVENSVKHGIAPHNIGGHIEIRCRQLNGHCEIEIMDTGKGFDKSATVSGFGLRSVKERLELYYGGKYDLQIHFKKGTCIKIILPEKRLTTKYLDLEKKYEVPNASGG